MIPRIIHQLWIAPNEDMQDLPRDVKSDADRWRSMHPEFEYKFWSARDALESVGDVNFGLERREILDSVNVCRFPAMQADLIRCLLLHTFGGFWVDLKLTPKSSFLGSMVDNELVLVEHHVTKDFPVPANSELLNNSFFGCQKNSDFIRSVAILAFGNVRKRMHGVWEVTGPRTFISVAQRQYPGFFEVRHPGLLVVRASEFYDNLVRWGWGSYNANGRHWSERMKLEPIYNAE